MYKEKDLLPSDRVHPSFTQGRRVSRGRGNVGRRAPEKKDKSGVGAYTRVVMGNLKGELKRIQGETLKALYHSIWT